jgi:hypothetical protein
MSQVLDLQQLADDEIEAELPISLISFSVCDIKTD